MAKGRAKQSSRTSAKVSASREKDTDFTIPGLIVIVATVLITALFFAQPNVAKRAQFGTTNTATNTGGMPIATGDSLAPKQCDATSICDGSRLIRQQKDCTQFVAYCRNGCDYQNGAATCI